MGKEYKESHPQGEGHSIATRSTTTPTKKRRAVGDTQQSGSEPPSAVKQSKKEEAKSKELGPMELAEQTKRRRSLHRRAEKQGLLGKMFALSKELQGVSSMTEQKN